jgi:pyruvate formate lyase activating enzyme
LPLADLILYDYKATGPAYQELIGVPEALILENLDFLYQRGANIILRCPMVPGVNDTHEHLQAIARLDRTYPKLAGIEILPYQNSYTSKFERYGYVNPLPNHPAAEEWHRQSWTAELERLEAHRISILY